MIKLKPTRYTVKQRQAEQERMKENIAEKKMINWDPFNFKPKNRSVFPAKKKKLVKRLILECLVRSLSNLFTPPSATAKVCPSKLPR